MFNIDHESEKQEEYMEGFGGLRRKEKLCNYTIGEQHPWPATRATR